MLVLVTQVFVHKFLSLTYEFLKKEGTYFKGIEPKNLQLLASFSDVWATGNNQQYMWHSMDSYPIDSTWVKTNMDKWFLSTFLKSKRLH